MVRLAAHPRITMLDPTPLITIDVEVTLPSTTTVPAPEGIVKIGVDVNGAVHIPPTHSKSELGRVLGGHDDAVGAVLGAAGGGGHLRVQLAE